MAKVGAQWRGFVSAIAIACATAGATMWSLGWLDQDVDNVGGSLLNGVRSFLGVTANAPMTAPDRPEIYVRGADTGKPFWGFGNTKLTMSGEGGRANSIHAGRGAVVGKPIVVDGDTVMLNGAKVRLWGVDAPEMAQQCSADFQQTWRCGQEAAVALKQLIAAQDLACYEKARDGNGVMVGQCFVGQIDVNGWITKNGWALAFREHTTQYVSRESMAKLRRAGVWRTGGIESPSEWRARQR